MNCNFSFVVYLLASSCGLQYVGQTTRPINCRFREHRLAILHKDRQSPIAQRFEGSYNSDPSSTSVVGIDLILAKGDLLKRKRGLTRAEYKWIFKLNSLAQACPGTE
ncbi:Hypothetical predicted protein [Pelobates cultripes]|uniref:GIY-YIG domain-containing protein n=1 Tax=Pelobates cultripes TaxID=61616 RepID=A0AAD1WJ78_PELCU|nr:Hypothetical predicted protein [Pelobates cultripes]